MKTKKVKGFNQREQAVYDLLAKDPTEPQSFADMKDLFREESVALLKKYKGNLYRDKKEVDSMAQSLSRNAIRRLIRDGWAEQCARGTYRLTRTGKSRLERGCDETPSYKTRRRKGLKTAQKEAETKKKGKPARKTSTKKAPKKKGKKKAAKKKAAAKPKAAPKPKKKSTTGKKKKKSSKGNGVTAKAKAAAKRAAKEASKEESKSKAASAAKRAAQAVQEEAAAN